MWDFGGKHVDEVIDVLKNAEDETVVSKMMRNILKVAEDNGLIPLRMDIPAMCDWIKSIIDENDISAILFVWDEFTEFFQNNQNALTGFQTLAEISIPVMWKSHSPNRNMSRTRNTVFRSNHAITSTSLELRIYHIASPNIEWG